MFLGPETMKWTLVRTDCLEYFLFNIIYYVHIHVQYIHVHVHMYIDIHIHVHIHVHRHMYTTYTCTHVHVHTCNRCTQTYIYNIYTYTYTCTQTYIYNIYMYTCTCTYMYRCTYVHTCNMHRDLKTDYTNTNLSMSQCKFFIIIIFIISTPQHFNRHITISLLSSIRPQSSTAFLLPLLY